MSARLLRWRHDGEVLMDVVPSEHPGWDRWEDLEFPEDGEAEVAIAIDIEEQDSAPPSRWAIEIDGKIVLEVDASEMSPEERCSIVPEEVRQRGREIFGDMIKDRVDGVLDSIEKLEEGK